MNTTIVNAAPRVNLLGIQDLSARAPVIEPEVYPTHLPHTFSWAEWGPANIPQLVSGDLFTTTFGAKTLDPRYKFFNHQSALVNELQGQGNSVMHQRIVPSDIGPKSRLLLSIDIVPEPAIQQYQRNADGTFTRSNTGALIPITGAGATLPGHTVRWSLNDWNNGIGNDPFAVVQTQQGNIVNSASAQSLSYPIMELEASFFGSPGNNRGIRLAAPHSNSASPLNKTAADALKANIYRLQLVSRADSTTTPQGVDTIDGDPSIEFTFKPNAIDPKTDTQYSIDDIFLDAYQNLDQRGFPPTYGPFGRLHIYRENLETVLAMIGDAEADRSALATIKTLPVNAIDADSDYLYSVNPFTALSYDGVPYYTVNVQGALSGGLAFTENSTHFAAGGSDGTLTDAAFDLAVRAELLNYGYGTADLLDDAMYPQSCIYDSGFELDTKIAMLTPIGRRKDIWVTLSTQIASAPNNTAAEESSIAEALKTAAQNYPESEVYGTKVCRAIIVGHDGIRIGSRYRRRLPLTMQVAVMNARYMGSGERKWRSGFAPSENPNNIVDMFRDVNATFKSANARSKDWATGLIWAQRFDRGSLFFPGMQTVYDDDSSILNSALNMYAAVELEKVCQRVWRRLAGIDGLTPEQFIERSDKLIEQEVEGRFDNRYVIVPNTYMSAADIQRGYSYSCKIDMFGPNQISVGTYTIVARRRSDLGVAA